MIDGVDNFTIMTRKKSKKKTRHECNIYLTIHRVPIICTKIPYSPNVFLSCIIVCVFYICVVLSMPVLVPLHYSPLISNNKDLLTYLLTYSLVLIVLLSCLSE